MLTLTDTNGCSDTKTTQVVVDTMPIANFGFIINGLQVSFTDSSIYAENWSWDFGDGFASFSQNPTYFYPLAGTYNVCLKLSKSNGCVDSICKIVNVSVGIDDGALAHQILIYPSIVKDQLFIEVNGNITDNVDVQIYNVIGEVMYGKVIEMMGKGAKLSIDMSSISRGVYFVIVGVGEKVVSAKVLKFF